MADKKKSLNLVNPYLNTTLTGRVYLKPNFLDNNIYIHMKTSLKNALEKKCSKYGYIHTIHKIIDYKDGLMVQIGRASCRERVFFDV